MAGSVHDLRFERLFGSDIERRLDPLAALRMAVFRDWPYLYEGDLDYERRYLGTYIRAPRALLVAALDGDRLVGATTAVPLADEDAALRAPFAAASIDADAVFYFGESLLLPAYRGRGLYRRFFDEREAHARSFGAYHTAAFAAVVRPADHPMRPAGERPLDPVWRHFGFAPRDDLIASFPWRDIGEDAETAKPMRFWVKALA